MWQACQEADAVLITGNRASGEGSLDDSIRSYGQPDSLPVMTIGDPRRVIDDREYAVACVARLLDFVDRIDALRGTGRLFSPDLEGMFSGNCPKNVSKDAKYGIKSNKKGGLAVGLTYCTDDDERWHMTTEAHEELAEMVSTIQGDLRIEPVRRDPH